jgi:hypothetical protein
MTGVIGIIEATSSAWLPVLTGSPPDVARHARSAFGDHDDPAPRRHLLRLWIALPGDEAAAARERYERVRRGGMPRRDDIAADGRRLAR